LDKSQTGIEIIQERKRRIFSIRSLVFLILSVITIIVLLKFISSDDLLRTLKNADLKYLVVCVLLYAVINFFKSIRLRLVLKTDAKISLLYIISSFHNFFNQILPARTGELTLIYYLKKYTDVTSIKSLHTIIVIRILDLSVVGLLFSVSCILYFGKNISLGLILSTIAVVIITLSLVLFLPQIITLIRISSDSILDKFNFKKVFFNRLRKIIRNVEKEFNNQNIKSNLIYILFMSVIIWLHLYLFFYYSIKFCGEDINLIKSVIGSTGAVLTQVIPINSFGNIGSLEAGWTIGFVFAGVPLETAIITGIGSHIVNFVSSVVLAIFSKLALIFIEHQFKK